MNDNGNKMPSRMVKVMSFAFLTFGIYVGMLKLLMDPINLLGNRPFSGVFLVTVLIFDALWLGTIKFWPFKNKYIKGISTLLVMAFSVAVATCYISDYILRDFRY